MNEWLAAAMGLMVGFIPLGLIAWRGAPMRALIAYELIGIFTVQILALVSESFGRTSFFEFPMILALLSLASTLVFVRFFERWI